MTDEQLVAKLQSGDESALSELVVRYQKKLFYYVVKLIGNHDDAEDVVQETFLKAYHNINSFDLDKKFSSWIYRIAHNHAINVAKKRSRTQAMEGISLDWFVEHEKEVDDFLATEERIELSSDIVHLLDEIRPDYRQVILLYYFEDKSYEEISDILQISQTTVGVWLNRAKDQIRKKLSTYERSTKN